MHGKDGYLDYVPTENELEAHVAESCKMVSTSYGLFKHKAAEQVRWFKDSSITIYVVFLFDSVMKWMKNASKLPYKEWIACYIWSHSFL